MDRVYVSSNHVKEPIMYERFCENGLRASVYISGPMRSATTEGWERNLRAFDVADRLLFRAGFSPSNPGLSGRLPGVDDFTFAEWMERDLIKVKNAQAVYRLPGPSEGADTECAYAQYLGIPVYTDRNLDDLLSQVDEMRTPWEREDV